MRRRDRERAALRALHRRVWGNDCYDRHVADRERLRRRRAGLVGIVAGLQMLAVAFGLVVFESPASAHTSEITISCTQVQFRYANFEDVTATAHEAISIDGAQGPQRDFEFTGPSATDTIMITLTPGPHTIDATTAWAFSGQPQGSAQLSQDLTDCGLPACGATTTTSGSSATTIPCPTTTSTTLPCSSTTTVYGSTTTAPCESTTMPETTSIAPATTTPIETTTVPATTTTLPESTSVPTTATTVPAETTTTVPAATTTTTPESTSTAPETTTSLPFQTTTTSIGNSTTTSAPGGTTTTMSPSTTSVPVTAQGVTTTASRAPLVPTSSGPLPFTGSSHRPFALALAMLGLGALAAGLARRQRLQNTN